MKVFVSHSSHDAWIARQMARCIQDAGAKTFIDVVDIETGDEFEEEIRTALHECSELVALITPYSQQRAWLFTEIAVVWGRRMRVCGVFYGVTLDDLRRPDRPGSGVLSTRNTISLNDFDRYLAELRRRIS